MLNTNDQRSGARPRWNDIRIVGPLLVVLMAATVLLNPGFVSADRSVGSIACLDIDECGVCPDGSIPTVFGFVFTDVCPEPAQEGQIDVVAAAPPIVGPLWVGAIQSSESAAGTTLKFPSLLGIFIDDATVKITSDGRIVYRGPLPASDTITLPGTGYGSITVHTSLFTSANYIETVNIG